MSASDVARTDPFRATLLIVALATSCQESAAPTEELTVTISATRTVAGLTFPQIRVTVGVVGTSTLGNVVSATAVTLGGAPAADPVLVAEGDHEICATVTSSSGMSASTCRMETLRWPRLTGLAVRWTDAGASVPSNLRMILQDTLGLDITDADGAFFFPSAVAELPEVKVRLEGDGIASVLLRPDPSEPIRAVLLPSAIAIPSCSVYGGLVVPLDLEGAFRRSSPTNTSFFDRASTQVNEGRIVVASWQAPSIGVALSDTGAASKRFTVEDSAEVRETLSEMTSYFCQSFHLTSVAEASVRGVMLHKDTLFAALGSHSMALPGDRGNYQRASVVVRRVAPVEPASRDTIRRTIMHELLHVLGMGHTCSWPSVMTTGTLCEESLRALKPSAEDVAHYLAMTWSREGERSLQTTYSLAHAYVADVVARGLAEPAVRPYYTSP